MATLTGNKQVDMRILQILNDRDLKNFSLTNKYVAELCNDEMFLFNRLLKDFKPDTIRKIKGQLSYKELYKYLNTDKKKIIKEAIFKSIRSKNLYLFKTMYNKMGENRMEIDEDTNIEILLEAADSLNFDVMSFFIFKSESKEDRENIVDVFLSLHDREIFEWLNLMNLTSHVTYISNIMINLDEYDGDYIQFLSSQIKDYIPGLEGIELTEITARLAENTTDRNIKFVKDIYKCIFKNSHGIYWKRNVKHCFITSFRKLKEKEKQDLIDFADSLMEIEEGK